MIVLGRLREGEKKALPGFEPGLAERTVACS